jgi:mRNA-degrading endonuclease toxin of MazEF toxin-antitoxin module
MITSRASLRDFPSIGDVPLEDWETEGLLRVSTLRCGRIVSLEKRLLKAPLGSLSTKDLTSMNLALRTVLDLK